MIIKFIAETELERKRFGGAETVEHTNVKEYFIVGNKIDSEGSIVDYHEWNGSFRYLLGTLRYFYELINDDRRNALRSEDSELPSITKGSKFIPMIKRAEGGKLQPLDISHLRPPKFKGNINDIVIGPVDEFIDDNGDMPEQIPTFDEQPDQKVAINDDSLKGLRINPTDKEE